MFVAITTLPAQEVRECDETQVYADSMAIDTTRSEVVGQSWEQSLRTNLDRLVSSDGEDTQDGGALYRRL